MKAATAADAEQALFPSAGWITFAILLPDTGLFLYTYVRKEAVLSSQIEGTQSSLSDLLLFELEQLPGVPYRRCHRSLQLRAALDHGHAATPRRLSTVQFA